MKKNGVTLIEMLIYMGLLSIILLVLTDIFSSVVNIQLESESASSVDQDGQYIISRYLYDMQRSKDITIPASVGETAASLVLLVEGTIFTYINSNGNLVLTKDGDSYSLNSSHTTVSNVSFTRYGNSSRNAIKFSFTVTSEIRPKSGPQSRNYQVTQGLRPN